MTTLKTDYKNCQIFSYVFLEFPSNPIPLIVLVFIIHLNTMHKFTDIYNFPVVINDTAGPCYHIDIMPVEEILKTSCPKSFSVYANVVAGTAVLSPLSSYLDQAHYDEHISQRSLCRGRRCSLIEQQRLFRPLHDVNP